LPFLKYNVKGQGKFTNRANLQAAIGLFAGFERDNGNDEQVSRRLIPRTGQPVPQLPRPRRPTRPPARSPRSAGHPSPGPVATFRRPTRPPARSPRSAGQPVPRPGRHAPQATRQGWPYYTRLLSRRHEPPVYSRATPIGVNLRPPQATRQGWPYERRDSTGGTNASYRVGPPLAGGLPGARTGLS